MAFGLKSKSRYPSHLKTPRHSPAGPAAEPTTCPQRHDTLPPAQEGGQAEGQEAGGAALTTFSTSLGLY